MEDTIKNEDPSVIKAYDHLKSILIPGESIEAWAIQRRLFAMFHRRVLIAATTGRFIVIRRGLIGGYEMGDFRWQDLGDVKIKVGVFGADLFIKKFASTDLAINKYTAYITGLTGFRKEQTQNVYRLSQAQDQSWREKRRIRELEELRAKSGGLSLGPLSGSTSPIAKEGSEDSTSRLKKAKDMLDNKLITDAEYESIKARIISEL